MASSYLWDGEYNQDHTAGEISGAASYEVRSVDLDHCQAIHICR